jgi:hypothetical protein
MANVRGLINNDASVARNPRIGKGNKPSHVAVYLLFRFSHVGGAAATDKRTCSTDPDYR